MAESEQITYHVTTSQTWLQNRYALSIKNPEWLSNFLFSHFFGDTLYIWFSCQILQLVSSFGGSGCVGGWAFNFLSRGSGGPLLDYRAGAFCGAIRSVKKYLVMISSLSLLFLLHHSNKADQMAWLKRHSYDCSNSCFLVLWLPFLLRLLNWFRLELYLAFLGKAGQRQSYWWDLNMNQSRGWIGWGDHQ